MTKKLKTEVKIFRALKKALEMTDCGNCTECPFNNYGENRNQIVEKYNCACGLVGIRNAFKEITLNVQY